MNRNLYAVRPREGRKHAVYKVKRAVAMRKALVDRKECDRAAGFKRRSQTLRERELRKGGELMRGEKPMSCLYFFCLLSSESLLAIHF